MNNIETFYHYNELIKNLLIKSSPKDVFLNKDHLIKYEDLLFSTLDYCFDIFHELLLILSVPGYNKDAAVELKNKIYQELLYAQSDYSR